MVSNTQSKPKLEKYWEIIVEWILQTDLQVGRRECRTDNMSMPDPFIAFNHNQTITKHGLSVMFKHRRLPPALPQHSCRHSLQEFRVCNVQKWLCSQPVYKHLPCNTKFHYMSPHCTSNNLKKTRKRERKKKSRLTIRLRPARKVRKNSWMDIMGDPWIPRRRTPLILLHLINISQRKTRRRAFKPVHPNPSVNPIRRNPAGEHNPP